MIKVINAGLMTTVQDNGRWGYQAFGMPVAGAMDRLAFKVANLLLGNDENEAALEFTMMGGEYEFTGAALVAITGADMSVTLDGQPVENWSSFEVSAGSKLNFAFAKSGCRAYLAVKGGLDLPLVLGSRATYTRAKVGGLEGRALKVGDVINFLGKATGGKPVKLAEEFIPQMPNEVSIRALLGPQDEDFTAAGISTLFADVYTITNEADRMGYRMEGAVIEHATKPDIVSDALCQGAIQVPGHGMPIVMMADRQTTGGYTKIGSVISSDLRILAQAKPGDKVRFVQVSDEEAVAALKVEQELYAKIKTSLSGQVGQSDAKTKQYKLTVNDVEYFVTVQEK